MLIYPQLTTGALIQYPVTRTRSVRTIVNTAADGTRFVCADPAGGSVQWKLTYRGLSDAELGKLQAFHAAAEGTLNGFTFVDPVANLLAWSEDLTNAAWSRSPLLTVSRGVDDPMGGSGGWLATNTGGGPQGITQTLNAPGGYLYCFSIYARSPQATVLTLGLGAQSVACPIGVDWIRLEAARNGDPEVDSITFGVTVAAGAAVDLFGPQVEAQPAASGYKASTTGGVYENARLADDTFRFTTTDVNRNSATLTIFYADHL